MEVLKKKEETLAQVSEEHIKLFVKMSEEAKEFYLD